MKKLNLEEGVNEIFKLINNSNKNPLIIGITGGSCSGKSYLGNVIAREYNGRILHMDDYYLGIKKIKNGNWDTPDAMNLELLREHIILLKQNRKIRKPVYDFKKHYRKSYEELSPSKIIIIDGLFSFIDILRKEIDIKVFIDVDENIRFKRRLDRDQVERGRTKHGIIEQWYGTVKPMYKKYVEPQRKYADIIITN